MEHLERMSSAQPEILACGEGELNVPGTNAGDMISRQAAIDECYPVTVDGEVYEVVQVETLMGLPSVQPEPMCVAKVTLTDEQVKEAFEKAKCEILAVLDAQPRPRGEWQITDAYPHNVHCSVCHKRFAQTHWTVWEDGTLPRNFCPNCGADMRGGAG